MREQPSKTRNNLKTLLSNKLSREELSLLYRSYDVVGAVAVIRVPKQLKNRVNTIAEAVMATHKNVKSVWQQTSPVAGDYRLRNLEWVDGRKTAETTYREHGCAFRVDLKRCYFSPRLSYERLRVARLVKPGETVVNMFAGVGCFSLIIAKHSEAGTIYSIDINPPVVEYMRENTRLNRVEDRVIPVLGDSKEIVEKELRRSADRILMPLPEKAYEYLDTALAALKVEGGVIHYYDFEHANKNEDPVDKVKEKVSQKLRGLHVPFYITFARIVRGTGPNWHQIALDVSIEKQI